MSVMPKLLADLASEIDQGFLEDTFEVAGHKYKLRLLSDGENNWKNKYIDGFSSALSLISQRRAATLAVAIRAIDTVAVDLLYTPAPLTADSTEVEKAEFDLWSKMGKLERQVEVSKKLHEYLSARPDTFTTALYEKFQELEERRNEVNKNLKKS